MKDDTYGLVRRKKNGNKKFIWVKDSTWSKFLKMLFESALQVLEKEDE